MQHLLHIQCPYCQSEAVKPDNDPVRAAAAAYNCTDCYRNFYVHVHLTDTPLPISTDRLLAIQKLELDTLLDVIRAVFSLDLDMSKFFMIVRNSLQGQFRLRKMAFYYLHEGHWREGMKVGFQQIRAEELGELTHISQLTYIFDHSSYPHLFDMGVECVIPIKNKRETEAYFILSDFTAETKEEIDGYLIFIETIGYILFYAIKHKILIHEQLKQEAVKQELEVAGRIQKQLLREDFQVFDNLDIHALNLPHSQVGGDFYDVVRRGKRYTFVCIADVTGKGMGAALLMSGLQASLRALCAQYDNLETIMQELNQILFDISQGDKFVTMFLAKIEHETNKCYYVNAGHNFPLLVQKGKMKELPSQCPPLGVVRPKNFRVKSNFFRLQAGDTLFMYTDGLCDQTNPQGTYFDMDLIKRNLRKVHRQNAKQIIQAFVQCYKEFAAGEAASDDLTLMTVKML